jgi:hypothetical protein
VSLPPPKKRENDPSSEKKTSAPLICTRSFAQILAPSQKYPFCGQALTIQNSQLSTMNPQPDQSLVTSAATKADVFQQAANEQLTCDVF